VYVITGASNAKRQQSAWSFRSLPDSCWRQCGQTSLRSYPELYGIKVMVERAERCDLLRWFKVIWVFLEYS